MEAYLKLHWITATVWGLVILLLALILLKWGTKIRNFISEVWIELGKCSWPWDPQLKGLAKYKELIDSTVVVVISSIMLAAFVTSADFVLMKVIGFLTRFDL